MYTAPTSTGDTAKLLRLCLNPMPSLLLCCPQVLSSVGFTAEMQALPVTSLSGGWKMKLALARAMLMKADIMLLDEPTNHLDVTNVAWLINYLTHLPQVTSMIVSHDSGFLDNVCTHIIHYENRKLKTYRVKPPSCLPYWSWSACWCLAPVACLRLVSSALACWRVLGNTHSCWL